MTTIEWTTGLPGHTGVSWNPLAGCSKVNAACTNCYAERMARRLQAIGATGYDAVVNEHGHWSGKVTLLEGKLHAPLHWKKPRVVFVNSMSDLFHESVPAEFIVNVFEVMSAARQHKFIVLTKRPERIKPVLFGQEGHFYLGGDDYLGNVAIGTSVHDQASADAFLPHLQCWSGPRVASVEPLLCPVDLTHHLTKGHTTRYSGLDWVIVGGESGPGARPMHPDWARAIRDQCVVAGVPFFFKQAITDGRKISLPTIDGEQYAEYPRAWTTQESR